MSIALNEDIIFRAALNKDILLGLSCAALNKDILLGLSSFALNKDILLDIMKTLFVNIH